VFGEIKWTDSSEDHIGRHGVTPREVRDVLYDRPRIVADAGGGKTVVFGTTVAGRCLLVVTAEADDGRTFIVTARNMTDQEKRSFQKKAR